MRVSNEPRFDLTPVLVGISNPWSKNPEHVLAPMPDRPHCSGSRLLRIIQSYKPSYTREKFLADFPDRVNLESVGLSVLSLYDKPRNIVVFGRDTFVALTRDRATVERMVFALKETPPSFMVCMTSHGHGLYMLPHPSGLNRWYNNKKKMKAVGSFLLQLVP